ncbi:alpha-L-fucosidase [Flavobacterium ginsengiterrae]|uniref:alpha-L-fucosidase n=1 Tax=Flavobacterium ginsengiterrae TaxID=871695 RepID=A0ABP7H433_9FLAO
MKKQNAYLILFSILLFICNNTNAQSPLGPIPSENQMRWQEMEYYAFVHLSVNTYTDMSWGKGDEDPKIFNPVDLDCRQWARIAKEAGMKGIIITAKHHSGFCLWPSKYTEYSVKNSPWKNGKGDIMREMSDACKEYGLKLGVYLSPWDRNHADYGKPEYITYFRNQLTELLTNYGEVFEVWFDGANGGDGYYGGANEIRKIDRKTYYDWENTYALVRKLQPKIVIWNDNGDRADLRWVGTEAGYVGETNWSLLNAKGAVTEDMLRHGLENGDAWVPGEVNTSIRPEWFYHLREDSKVKTVNELMETYYNSIGRNGTLLLNFPIMPNGLIHKYDEKAVLDFAQAQKEAFAKNLAKNVKVEVSSFKGKFDGKNIVDADKETFWTTEDNVKQGSITLHFNEPVSFNRFLVQEYIKLGQRVKSFTVEAFVNGEWKQLANQTTIGYKRILCFPTVKSDKIRFSVTDAKGSPVISNIEVYNAPQILTAPKIIREKSGDIAIIPADAESEIFYTIDGKTPTSKSIQYKTKISTNNKKVTVKAIAYSNATGKSSPVIEEIFDIGRQKWTILNTNDKDAAKVLDGNPETVWHQNKDQSQKLPIDLIIDLGQVENLTGFRYLPDQDLRSHGIITNYKFYTSTDNKNWKLVSEGEFSNINNNPLWQSKTFKLEKARYIKLQALKNTKEDNIAGYAEIDVITK